MPPKPPIPSPKDLDDAIQATNEHLATAICDTHLHIDERFQASNQNLEPQLHMMQTRMENQDQLQATRHESLKSYLTKLLKQTHQPVTTAAAAGPSSILSSTQQSRLLSPL